MKKLQKLIDYLKAERAKAKDEMLNAAIKADVQTVLSKAGEQTAFDLAIRKTELLFKKELSKVNQPKLHKPDVGQ